MMEERKSRAVATLSRCLLSAALTRISSKILYRPAFRAEFSWGWPTRHEQATMLLSSGAGNI